jgi:hypothetical protein
MPLIRFPHSYITSDAITCFLNINIAMENNDTVQIRPLYWSDMFLLTSYNQQHLVPWPGFHKNYDFFLKDECLSVTCKKYLMTGYYDINIFLYG